MNQEIFLMNFRIPSGLKMQFEETCHEYYVIYSKKSHSLPAQAAAWAKSLPNS